ncbi:MAG: hypothetical protein IJW53_05260 [Clostridia bacterium]|nr:hypothetical protein [Clostridia bacterium]
MAGTEIVPAISVNVHEVNISNLPSGRYIEHVVHIDRRQANIDYSSVGHDE